MKFKHRLSALLLSLVLALPLGMVQAGAVSESTALEAVRAIKADGWLAVLAHPGQLGNFPMIPALVQAGLDGIEYNHPSHDPENRKKVKEAAKTCGLLLTGGSDFHGRYEKTVSHLGEYPAPESSEKILFG